MKDYKAEKYLLELYLLELYIRNHTRFNYEAVKKAMDEHRVILIIGVGGPQGKSTLVRLIEQTGYDKAVIDLVEYPSEFVSGKLDGYYMLNFGQETLKHGQIEKFKKTWCSATPYLAMWREDEECDGNYICSSCGAEATDYGSYRSRYCPHCGYRMVNSEE